MKFKGVLDVERGIVEFKVSVFGPEGHSEKVPVTGWLLSWKVALPEMRFIADEGVIITNLAVWSLEDDFLFSIPLDHTFVRRTDNLVEIRNLEVARWGALERKAE